MSELADLQILWHRLWLQVDDPAFAVSPPALRRELAQIWASIDAVAHLRQDDQVIEFAVRCLRRSLVDLAVGSLRATEAAPFDGGFWQSVLAGSSVSAGPVPDLRPTEWPMSLEALAAVTQVELMTEILNRITPERVVVATPVMAAADQPPVRGERSRPGWRLNGLASGAVVNSDCTHCAVFAIDEGDNEILGLVRVDAPGLTIDPTGEVRCDDIDLSAADVVTGQHERAHLEDRLTLIDLAQMLRSATASSGDPAYRLEVALAVAAMDAAASVVDLSQVTQRSRGVSAAVTCVQPTCVRIAGLDERFPEQWHQQRMVAFL